MLWKICTPSDPSSTVAAAVVVSRAVLHGHVVVEEFDAALLLELSVAPSLGVAEDEVNALDALCGDLGCRLLTTRAPAEREETEVGEADALAVEDEFLEAVEGVHQNAVDGASRVRRVVLGDVGHEVLKLHGAVLHCGGIVLLLASVLAYLWSALHLTILQSSFYSHNR